MVIICPPFGSFFPQMWKRIRGKRVKAVVRLYPSVSPAPSHLPSRWRLNRYPYVAFRLRSAYPHTALFGLKTKIMQVSKKIYNFIVAHALFTLYNYKILCYNITEFEI